MSWRKFCVHHLTMHQFTVSLHSKPHGYVCLAVTCHLHFWQNDWDLLCATTVNRGWNRYWNESTQKIDPWRTLLLGFEPRTFRSRVWCCNHWAIPTPSCDDMISLSIKKKKKKILEREHHMIPCSSAKCYFILGYVDLSWNPLWFHSSVLEIILVTLIWLL